jgi:poly-gamma-glutamate synthesis protein (capsule biosynthesis protein)
MTSALREALVDRIRYEDGRWPLWRWDRNLRYLTKSLLHRKTPWSEADRLHAERARAYLEGGTWRRPLARPSRVLLGGDLMWIRRGFRDALSPALRARIAAADLALVNLETPIVPERPVPTYAYETLHYNAPAEYLDAWRSERPRVVSLCNNHALDQGFEGLRRTREVVRAMGFAALGGPDAGDESAELRVGGLAVRASGVTYGINHSPAVGPAGVPVERFGADDHEPDWGRYAHLRRDPRDLELLAAHWGFEYEYWPAARQRAHALRLIELGVDVIVGSSPHVLQPIELVSIDGADLACPSQVQRGGAPRFGLIAWSLGNLSTIMPTLACRVGALVEFDVGRDDAGGLAFGGLWATPTVSARGLGGDWLDGATLSLEEFEALGRRGEAPPWPCRQHARTMLGRLADRTEECAHR